MSDSSVMDFFRLDGKVVVITGGAGFLGIKHAEAVVEAGGRAVLLDINQEKIDAVAERLRSKYGDVVLGFYCDITNKLSIHEAMSKILSIYGRIDGLVNNAANDPKVGPGVDSRKLTRFENLTEEFWNNDIDVGLTGAFFCSQVFGHYMAMGAGGVIVNIASDLAVISPDQRLYRQLGLDENSQPVKPVTYSVVKSGLLGLNRYLSTYWVDRGVRVNAISPGGIFNGQNPHFLEKLEKLIPMGRMAKDHEIKGALVFLLSDASSYMTGQNLIVDGGRSIW
jgi:NAD(P)-dependent dehydrogenase (short-subunit alcohol dehydrogenase family)